MPSPRVSVIIPNFNGRHHLGPCLESVTCGSVDPADRQVVVVDNGSSDGSVAWVAALYPDVDVVCLDENRGFTGAIAAGVAAADGEILVFLNNDTRADALWLETLVSTLADAPPEVATVTGRIVSWDGSRLDFWRGGLTFDGHAFQLDFGRPAEAVAEAGQPADLPFPCGGNMAVRREAWEKLGGFDDDYFAYTEDVDFGWRCWLAGWDHRYQPDAVVHHRSGATGERLGIYRRGYLFEKNAFMTVYKNLEDGLFQRLMPAVLWTLLHRTWALLEGNNADGGRLANYPFPPHSGAPDESAIRREGLARRLRRHGVRESVRRALLKAAGALGDGRADAEQVVVHDPRTVQQLRAIRFLLANLDRLAARRAAVQELRVRSDREYFRRFPMLRVPTYPGDTELFASDGFKAWFPADVEFDDRKLEEVGELLTRVPSDPED